MKRVLLSFVAALLAFSVGVLFVIQRGYKSKTSEAPEHQGHTARVPLRSRHSHSEASARGNDAVKYYRG